MHAPIHLRFRPGLVIFADEMGQHICAQFISLLQRTKPDSILCQGMALLQLDTQERTATRLSLTKQNEQTQASTAQAKTFELLVTQTLQEIQSNRLIADITRAGYPVPDPRAQIYIICDPARSPLTQIQQALQAQLQRINNHSFICSMLHTQQTSQLDAPLDLTLSPRTQSRQEPAHFCYLYQGNSTQPHHTFLSEDEVCYAMAEALFSLLFTGITTEPFFLEMIRGSTGPTTLAAVGSLGTSLVLSPRETIQRYCALRLGRDLLEQWRRDLQEKPITTSRLEELRAGACGFARTLTQWLEESQERPLTNVKFGSPWKISRQHPKHLSPSLDVLHTKPPSQTLSTEDPTRLHHQLFEQARALFTCFWPEAVQRAFTHQSEDTMSWSELVAHRAEKAPERYNAWSATATLAWQAATTLINAQLRQIITETSQVDETGLHLSALYIEEFATQLAQLERRCLAWQTGHQRSYSETMRIFSVRAGLPQASSTSLEATPHQADKQLSPALTTEEAATAQRLGERLTQREAQVPSPAAQALIALPFLIAVLITLPLFYPVNMLANIIAGVSAITFLAHGLFRYQRRHAMQAARSDLLTFYRLLYIHHCEMREDELRADLLQKLKGSVRDLCTRLHALAPYFGTLRDQLAEQAERLQQELFSSPACSRDVLVVNGELLQRGESNALEEIVEQVNKMRTLAPVQPWHQTLPTIQQHFLRTLTATGQSLPTNTQDDLLLQLIAFTQEIVQSYCSGEMTEISLALVKNDAWREAFAQARNLLYQPRPGMSEQSLTFVCGREREFQRGAPYIPDDVYPVYLPEAHPWLIIATFSRGNLLTTEESYARTYTHTRHDSGPTSSSSA